MNTATYSTTENATLAILGGGFLGGFVAGAAKHRYREIYACVAHSKARPSLESHGAEIRVGDIFAPDAAVLPQTPNEIFDVIFMIPPSVIADDGSVFAKLVGRLSNEACRRALLISSSGIYTPPDGALVSAETAIGNASGRAAKLLSIENQWLSGGDNFRVLRLAGLYGPGRVVGAKPLLAGSALGGSPDAWLNLIHAEDAAELSLHCLGENAHSIELGADGHPVKRVEYYQFVATLIDSPPPNFSGEAKRNTLSKRCDPRSTFARLNFTPKFSHYTDGVRASLAASSE